MISVSKLPMACGISNILNINCDINEHRMPRKYFG